MQLDFVDFFRPIDLNNNAGKSLMKTHSYFAFFLILKKYTSSKGLTLFTPKYLLKAYLKTEVKYQSFISLAEPITRLTLVNCLVPRSVIAPLSSSLMTLTADCCRREESGVRLEVRLSAICAASASWIEAEHELHILKN